MKGFRPTGYGPSAGFKFPSKMGFTGSTGAYTNVSPYVRRKGFAAGGFVRQDNPRMKCEVVGDQGSALVRRARPSTAEDQESGGKSPLRPGFKKGGRAVKRAFGGGVMSRAMQNAVARAKEQQQQVPASKQPLGDMSGGLKGALSQLAMRARQQTSPSPQVRTPEVGRKLRGRIHAYAEGGVVTKGHGPLASRRQKQPQPRAGAIKGKFYANGGPAKWQREEAQEILQYAKAVHEDADSESPKSAKETRDWAQRVADEYASPNHRLNLNKTKLRGSYRNQNKGSWDFDQTRSPKGHGAVKPPRNRNASKGHGPVKAMPGYGRSLGSFADGGKVKGEYPKPSYMEAVKDRVKEIFTSPAKSSTGMAKQAADKLEARRSRIDSAVDEAVNGKNYARGGKARKTNC